jgi:hypothetical protein
MLFRVCGSWRSKFFCVPRDGLAASERFGLHWGVAQAPTVARTSGPGPWHVPRDAWSLQEDGGCS